MPSPVLPIVMRSRAPQTYEEGKQKTVGRDGIENGERNEGEGLIAIVKEPRHGEGGRRPGDTSTSLLVTPI